MPPAAFARRARGRSLALAAALTLVVPCFAAPAAAAERDSTATAPIAPIAPSTTVAPTAPPVAPPALAPPRVGGYMQLRSTAQEEVGLTTTLAKARLMAEGALPSRFSYRLLAEFEASAGAKSPSTPSLREAFVKWSPAPYTLTLGQLKTPFTREYLVSTTALETPDLSVAIDSLATKYDIGLMGEAAFGTWATLALGAFNGEGQNASANRDSTVLWIARVTATPHPALGLGASVTHEGPDSLRWGLDAGLDWRGALVRADWLTRHRKGRVSERDDKGWSVLAGYRVTPRVLVLGRLDDLARPWIGESRHVRGTDVGVDVELVPNRVRAYLHATRRTTGKPRASSDALIAQLQVRY